MHYPQSEHKTVVVKGDCIENKECITYETCQKRQIFDFDDGSGCSILCNLCLSADDRPVDFFYGVYGRAGAGRIIYRKVCGTEMV